MFTAELSACGGNDATTSFLAFCFFNLMNVELSRDKNSVYRSTQGEDVTKFSRGIFKMSYRSPIHEYVHIIFYRLVGVWGKWPWDTSHSWIEDWMMK